MKRGENIASLPLAIQKKLAPGKQSLIFTFAKELPSQHRESIKP
tara:strand:- start:2 stop:133 length:132 start_codon:yes stop_codon:yes gene_type:complete